MLYFTVTSYSMYSYLDGFSKPEDNAKRAKSVGIHTLAITDHGSVCGHVKHIEACKKQKIRYALGTELYISHQNAKIREKENRQLLHQVVWAKNYQGWKTLCKIISQTNDVEYYYYKPRIHLFGNGGLESLLDGNIMSFSGHQGSALSNILFADIENYTPEEQAKLKAAYSQCKEKDIEYYAKFLRPDWLEKTCQFAIKLEKIFGKGNFGVELQDECSEKDIRPLWVQKIIVRCLRTVSKETGIPALISSDPHYANPEDAENQRAMVMVNMKETESSVQEKLDSETENDVMVFFGSNNFYIHSPEEMAEKFTKEEMENSVKFAEQVEQYEIKHKPYIPQYNIPKFDDSIIDKEFATTRDAQYLMYLCIQGARKLKPWESEEAKEQKITKEKYWERLKSELKVLFGAGLSPYLLIVQDYINAARFRPADHSFDWETNLKNGGKIDPIVVGVGRGSSGGCLAAYLLGITEVDPLIYGLFFGRFYNSGRNTKDHVELPDIDTDMSVNGREWVIEYIKHKYGKNNVGQIVTFQKMMGKNAVKDIFRIKGIDGGFDLANQICKHIPGESEIMDEIQQAKEDGEEDYNTLLWSLDNSKDVREYYDNDPKIKEIFDQAIGCEGIIRGQGRHPSAVVITPEPIEECFPMVIDRMTKKKMAGYDMKDIEKLGAVKYDILGVSVLDKLKLCQDLVNK